MSLKPAFDNLGLSRLICYNYGFTVQLLSGSKIDPKEVRTCEPSFTLQSYQVTIWRGIKPTVTVK